MNRRHPNLCLLFCAALWSCAALSSPAEDESIADATEPLNKGDAILIRIDGVGGGIPTYREIVDADGNIELPYLGFLPADGKLPADLEAEMADAYADARLSTNASAHITYVTHFNPPPDRETLRRSGDPRQPVPAPTTSEVLPTPP